ncbi:hypothetical protein OC834_002130 [Tilletia horrida]|uniref:Uncharacterized protein n=1 Tax=Tilletia horrida TaxID=155126 RepID=A0AAN6JNI0_9BASI|nr:hypothetical protein OC835_003773 [Tilletia horrida]KAK0533717.1 hypothetical protein OC834_002130 [Tilletia horrida]KAK0540678.1 hypothetical protein OC842_000353 [Tilletia horrida]
MSYTQRLVPVFVASLVGVATGIYVFQPLLVQYKADTHGSFRPEQKDLKLDAPASAGAGGATNTAAAVAADTGKSNSPLPEPPASTESKKA